ncbi:LacI family transcriptional regulator [Bifidobacterium amazonense]|uniref:LacI family transcriptional regulator n=1 Tax=Bifidobacterium amazonense TaxID=2809027 RepID=A0ABS9VT19_9BIFI|nr:LacI family DNA-binding transcriptional regulator [Bifidobacterium amazonense]MCH9275106.1 LacI family transcriptional regulator [Bifidobacterium amazonense]
MTDGNERRDDEDDTGAATTMPGRPASPSPADAPHAPHRVTIRDVAALAGVSPSTVSRAFALPDRVSTATVKRILDAAERLGYHDDRVESRPAGKPTKLVGIIVPDIANQFFSTIMRGVQRELQGDGISLMVAESREDARAEREAFDRLAPYADGMVLAGSRMPDATIRKCAQTRPLVVVNREVRGVPSVVVDVRSGIDQALQCLTDHGHRRVTYLDGPAASWSAGVRWKTLKAACERHGVTVRRLWPNPPTFDGGAAAAERYVASPTDAVVAHNDLMAAGFMAAMRARGVRCPDDYSLLGFDDGVVARICDPAIASINLSVPKLGAYAARILLRRLAGEPVPGRITVPSSLTERASIADAR